MHCSVIIVNYNTKVLTISCIQSIQQQTHDLDYEIILVDNQSVDGSQEIQHLFPEIKFIQADRNLGFGKANNLGATHASGKYLFFLNSDTVIKNNAIKIFYDYFEKNSSRLGCVGCKLLDENLRVNGNGGKFPTLRNYLIGRFSKPLEQLRLIEKFSYQTNKVEYILGADMFLSKNLFTQSGGFDPNYFMYYEESDLQLTIKKMGYANEIIEGPMIIHLEGKSSKQSLNKIKMVRSSAFYYFKKNRPFLEYAAFRTIGVIEAALFFLKGSYSFTEKVAYFKFNLRPLKK